MVPRQIFVLSFILSIVSTTAFTSVEISRIVSKQVPCHRKNVSFLKRTSSTSLFDSNMNDPESEQMRKERLAQLGFSEDKKMPLSEPPNTIDEANVNVNLIGDIDPVTITALGFAAIAANFLIFANMGDGGIGGVVARIINFFR